MRISVLRTELIRTFVRTAGMMSRPRNSRRTGDVSSARTILVNEPERERHDVVPRAFVIRGTLDHLRGSQRCCPGFECSSPQPLVRSYKSVNHGSVLSRCLSRIPTAFVRTSLAIQQVVANFFGANLRADPQLEQWHPLGDISRESHIPTATWRPPTAQCWHSHS